MATRLTEIYKTEDGKFFGTLAEAEAHESAQRMLNAIRQASVDARHDTFGRTHPCDFHRRLAEELVRQGFVYGGSK